MSLLNKYDSQDFLRSSLVGNGTNLLQADPTASQLNSQMGAPGGIDLMVHYSDFVILVYCH